ncbi:MAG TPA: UDP-3-O-acyl-N-acetylglucosamine deacetylase [Planctomycetota bacterium]|nr:UDP-3-O-acyl-N-acetylglucosamine deacetylase [Planctomycetota bacterium]
MSRRQRTLAAPAELSGAGLHEGRGVTARLLPAPAGTGVVFRRADLPGAPEVRVAPDSLGEAARRTQLVHGSAEVHTVEHLLAALLAAPVDNVLIELDGPELPGLDGSARPWVQVLQRAGAVEQREPRRTLVLSRVVSVAWAGGSLRAEPGPGLELDYTLDYSAHGLPPQRVQARFPGTDFAAELAPARTFVLAAEARELQAAGLGRGATPENTVVLEPGYRPAHGSLRFPDEPARHKMLDLLGDLALLGADLQARVVAVKSGHRAHHELVRKLAAELAGDEAA